MAHISITEKQRTNRLQAKTETEKYRKMLRKKKIQKKKMKRSKEVDVGFLFGVCSRKRPNRPNNTLWASVRSSAAA